MLSGGYEDDEDLGDEIIYTGHGGQENKIQVRDQELTRQNLALAISAQQGLPVRVVRGAAESCVTKSHLQLLHIRSRFEFRFTP